MKQTSGVAVGVAAVDLLSAFAGEMTCSGCESFVTAVESIPPVLRADGLEAYSTNKLGEAK